MELTRGAPENEKRRRFFKQGWLWVLAFIAGLLCYPVFRFINFKAPRKPRVIKVHRQLKKGGFFVERDFILFEGEKGPWAVSRKCTHLGCRVNLKEKENILLCPCHQSRFTTTGNRVSGPAQRDLSAFKVEKMTDSEGPGYIVTL